VRTTLASTRLRVRPGTPTSLDVEVVNTSDVIDGVSATVLGLDAAWVQMSPPVLTLFPESVGRFTLLFDLPTVCPAGDSMLLLRISSTVDPSRHAEHDVWLTVDPVESATLALRPSVVVGGSTADLDVQVTNTGNVTTEFAIAGLEPTRAVECIADPPTLVVEPGRTASALLEATGPRPWFGQSVARNLQITATSPTIALTETARFTQKPRIPRGVLTTMILAGIIALWAFIFLFVVQLIRGNDAPAKAVPTNWNEGGAAEVNLADVAGAVTGQVTAATTGEAMARITVEAYRRVPNAAEPELTASAATTEDGSYTLGALLPGKYHVRFSADGFDPLWYPGTSDLAAAETIEIEPLGGRDSVDMALTGQPATLSGKVPLPDGADPSVPAKVTITLVPERPGDPVPEPVVIETTGDFTVPDLESPATYRVRVERPGFDPEEFDIQVGGGQSTVIDSQRLAASDGGLQGVVTDAAGSPLGGVTVTIRSGTLEQDSITPTTGNVGAFQIENLPTPNTYVLTFSKEGYSDTTIALDLAGGESRTGLQATLIGGSGTLLGTILGDDGTPLGGVAVTATRGTIKATTTSLTAGDGGAGVGSYRLADLSAPGVYTVTYTLAGYSTETTTVTFVAADEQPTIDMTMRRSTGTVLGRVTVDGAGRAGLSLELSDGTTPRTSQTASNPSGGYEFTGVPPGAYMLRITGAGVAETVVLIDVVAGQTTERNVGVAAQ
jgi:hypothetical protein